MIRDLDNVYITSNFFGQATPLKNLLKRPLNIVYGNNGTGKSTISKAFYNYANNLSDESAPMVDFETKLPDRDKEHIYVFNEKFIHENIDIPKGGLEAIVMVGAAGNLNSSIDSVNGRISTKESEISAAKTILQDKQQLYDDNEKEIISNLKKKDSYLERSRSLTDDGTNKRVILDTILKQAQSKEVKEMSYPDLLNQFQEGVAKFKQAKNGAPITWSNPTYTSTAFTRAAELLGQKVEQPSLSEREKQLLEIIAQGHDIIKLTRNLVINSDHDFCPFCQQGIDHQHKATLKESIDSLETTLGEKSKEYESQLRTILDELGTISTTLPEQDTFAAQRDNLRKQEDCINKEIQKIKNAINARLENLYAEPVKYNTSDFSALISNYNSALGKFKDVIDKYNDELTQNSKLLKELERLNCCLGCIENIALINARYSLEVEKGKQKKVVDDYERELDNLNTELSGYKAQASQINIALDYINECLSFIFFSKDRLVLKVLDTDKQEGVYALYTHGHRVNPDDVSIGERNAIALAYFFAQTFKGLEERQRFREPSLYVIDDPVSSFDQNNRAGILSFLRQQIHYILQNSSSKVLLLTHDLHTANEIAVIAKDYWLSSKDLKKAIEEYPYMELCNKAVQYVPCMNQAYRDQFSKLFEYAKQTTDNRNDPAIGNQMRQILEAYANFCYGSGIDYMLGNPEILELVPEEFREFYRRIAVNMVLNSTSHPDSRIDPFNSYSTLYQASDMHALAQYILLFIFFTNENHFRCMAKDCFSNNDELSSILCAWEDNMPYITLPKKHERTVFQTDQVYVIEQDEDNNCHCGNILLHFSASQYVGKKVRLTRIRPNTNYLTKDYYPRYSEYNLVE